jgi:hypothetical protein
MEMPTDANGEELRHGYRIKVRSLRYNVDHHGIVSGIHRIGDLWFVSVVHNTKEWGVQVTTLEDFAQGQPTFVVDRPHNPQHTEFILATARENLQKPYSLLFQNCEHFCNYCYACQKKSESIEGVFAVGALFGVVAFAAYLSGE